MTEFLNRKSAYPVNELFLTRVSGRAFSEERLTEEELMSLFEAARWAPSSYNNQPWRFVYARRGDPEWPLFFDVLVDFNKQWTKNADSLVLVLTKKNFEHNGKPSVTASFDTGAAWMSLALEAHLRNIIAHGMQGFNYEAIREKLQIPDTFTIQAMVAIGKPGLKENLPEDIRKQEIPSLRKPLEQIVSRGKFTF